MWRNYFEVVKIVPGEVIVPGYGKIDFSKDYISVEMCKDLFENDFPYLKITEEGKNFFYGTPDQPVISRKIRKINSRIK